MIFGIFLNNLMARLAKEPSDVDLHAAIVKKHLVVGTQAEDIAFHTRSAVPKWLYVVALRVLATVWQLDRTTAYLASMTIRTLDLSCELCVA